MKILDGFVLRQLGQEFIVTGEGLSRVDFSKVVSMNKTAAYLWEQLQGKEFTPEDMATLLTEHYDVSSQTALEDAVALCDSWRKAGLIAE
ncbi:MAG: PqqD family protein [Bacteroidales bacterium]|nr:PqqD family protein [Bacteroidales bacterium]